MTFLYISKNLTIQIIENAFDFINEHLYMKADNIIYNKKKLLSKNSSWIVDVALH